VRPRPWLHSLLLAAGLAAGDLVVVQAIESAGLAFDTLEGAGWSVHDASATLDQTIDNFGCELGNEESVVPPAFVISVIPGVSNL